METIEKPWKRMLRLAMWLHFILPVGIWKLYKDPVLSSTAKWRVFIYLFAVPWLAYLAFMLWTMNSTLQKYLP